MVLVSQGGQRSDATGWVNGFSDFDSGQSDS